MIDLSGQRVLVTGTHRGSGAACATALAGAGAAVICADRRLSGETVATVRAAGGTAEIWQCDVADPDSVGALFDALRDSGTPLDAVVHCARFTQPGPAHAMALSSFDRMLGVNLRGTFRVGCEAIRMMADRGGRLIVCAQSPAGPPGPASALQQAVAGLARSWAVEGAPHIAVNAIALPETADAAERTARLALLLAGPEGAALTGQVLSGEG